MNSVRVWRLPGIDPELPAVLGRMGYNSKKSELSPELSEMISQYIHESKQLCRPVGLSLEVNIIDRNDQTVWLENDLAVTSQKFSLLVQNSRTITLMAMTVGFDIEEAARQSISAGDVTRGVVIDAAGSESVEAFADYMTAVLAREKALLRKKPTMRYSPGYGDMALSLNFEILEKLSAPEQIGLQCDLETNLLQPEKSITALIGWE